MFNFIQLKTIDVGFWGTLSKILVCDLSKINVHNRQKI